VEERRERLDLVREQLVDEPVVESSPAWLTRPRPSGRTRGHAIENLNASSPAPHERDVVAVAVVEVARDRAGVAAPDLPGVAENRSQTLSPRPSSCTAPSIW